MANQFTMKYRRYRYIIVLHILLLCNSLKLANSYCWQAGWNPGFNGNPTVTQITITSVQVSWQGVVINVECADQFVVKYWKLGTTNYKMSDLVANNIEAVILTGITPRVEYNYQVVAREDKGALLGIDYNRSPVVKFTTSRLAPNVKPSNDNNLNVVNVQSYDKGPRKKPNQVVVIKPKQVGPSEDTYSDEEEIERVLESKGKHVIHGTISDDEEEGINVILLVLIVIGVLLGSLIMVGVLYNCVKRRKQGRNLFTGTQLSLEEIDGSEEENDSHDDSNPQNDGDRSSICSKCSKSISQTNINIKETKVGIEQDKEEINPLLESLKANPVETDLNNEEESKDIQNDTKLTDEE